MSFSRIAPFALLLAAACGDDARKPANPYVPAERNSQTSPDMGMPDDGPTNGAPSCPSGSSCAVTCALLLDPAFCWTVGSAEAYACMDGTGEGVMASDGRSCSDGDFTAAFAEPLELETLLDRETWDITLTRDGSQCARFTDSGDTMALETANGRAAISFFPDSGIYEVTCGTQSWQTTDIMGLFDCNTPDGISALPGRSIGRIGGSWGLQLLPEPSDVFTCRFGP